jgi:pyrroloquinoline-quinone synthase
MDANFLDAIVANHDINEHPFYRAWRAGTLPRANLAAYASEYAPFVASIELGWSSLGCFGHAETEREHARLWDQFREALGATAAVHSACPEAKQLVDEARRSFADPVEAVGALYAFEAQQPSTARSKLDGLRAHVVQYAVPEDRCAYFREHADDYGEREQLRGLVARLTASERARAENACERVCKAMWSALDGIMRDSAVAESPAPPGVSAVLQ